MAKNRSSILGSWSFLIGVILAVVFGFMGAVSGSIAVVLVVLGLIIGLLNVAGDEAMPFLLSGVSLIIISSLGQSSLNVIPQAGDILSALMTIFVPATIIVAIKNVFSIASR